jgi:toxin ParE1/3/4
MKTKLHPGARLDLLDAQRWYEASALGLGQKFRRAVDEGVARLRDLPLAAPLWPGIDTSLGVRRYLLHAYPYSIAYLLRDHMILILAVAHQRRTPGYWLDRVG